MASYRGHVAVAVGLGAVYGAVAAWYWHLDWGPSLLAVALTTLGGLLPDLDSDSGVPTRELFSLAGIAVPVLFIPRLRTTHLTTEQFLVILAGIYLLVRYGAAACFHYLTVHRGMFHSIPTMAIAGLTVFLTYNHSDTLVRIFLAGAVMIGFLSHLVLDEISAVDFTGCRVRLRSVGSALKWTSSSLAANTCTYGILIFLGTLAWLTW